MSEGAREPYFSTRLISLSNPKVIQIISNNVKHNKFEKQMESEMKFDLKQGLQTVAKNVPLTKHLAVIFLCGLLIVKQLPIL